MNFASKLECVILLNYITVAFQEVAVSLSWYNVY